MLFCGAKGTMTPDIGQSRPARRGQKRAIAPINRPRSSKCVVADRFTSLPIFVLVR